MGARSFVRGYDYDRNGTVMNLKLNYSSTPVLLGAGVVHTGTLEYTTLAALVG